MRYYLIAGESSGDQYGALLIKELKMLDPNAEFRFWGGPRMKEQSQDQDMSIKETSFMGLWMVLKNIFKILGFFNKAKRDILSFEPELLILIDYPGFNLRMLKWAKTQNIKTAYYISPQIWAWRKYRYRVLADNADLFYVILPFEKKIYDELGVRSKYFGHPLLDIAGSEISPSKRTEEIKNVGLFPGSRKQELVKLLDILLAFARKNKDLNFYLSVVEHLDEHIYTSRIKNTDTNIILSTDLKTMMRKIDLGIACSGTISLELCLYEIPQIILYKAPYASYIIAKSLIQTKFISLVNLIAGKELIKELIQKEVKLNKLNTEFEKLRSIRARENMLSEYRSIKSLLGKGDTSKLIAQDLYTYISN